MVRVVVVVRIDLLLVTILPVWVVQTLMHLRLDSLTSLHTTLLATDCSMKWLPLTFLQCEKLKGPLTSTLICCMPGTPRLVGRTL